MDIAALTYEKLLSVYLAAQDLLREAGPNGMELPEFDVSERIAYVDNRKLKALRKSVETSE